MTVIFLGLIGTSIFFSWLATRVKNKGVMILCSLIAILIPSILGGLRQIGVGRDMLGYGIYTPREVMMSRSFLDFMSDKKELGYNLLCYVTMKTLGNVHWCFFFYQLITVACYYVGAYKHRKFAPLPMTMFIFFAFSYNESYNMMRQSMALSIIFMGLDNLEQKKYRNFLWYIIAAFMFHSSSIAVVLLVLITHMLVTHKSYFRDMILYGLLGMLLIIKPVALALISATNIVPVRYLAYVESGGDSVMVAGYAGFQVLFYCIEYIVMIVYAKGGKKLWGYYNYEYLRYNLLLVIMFYYVIRLFPRLTAYNDWINYLLLSSLACFVKDKKTRFCIFLGLIVALSRRWVEFTIIREANECWPYKSIL